MSKEQFFFSQAGNKVAENYNYMAEDLILHKSNASNGLGRTFVDFDNNLSIKSDYNRRDYEYFRNNTSNLTIEQSIDLAQKAYEKVGIIRNIIDTLSDLCSQGIRIQHPVRKTERFLQAWAEHVEMTRVSSEFANLLYRLCNVPVKSSYGTINWPDEEEWSMSKGGLETTILESPKAKARNIPLKYTFIHPNCIKVVGGTASLFVNKPYYVLKVTDSLKADLAQMNSLDIPSVKKEYDKMLAEINKSVTSNNRYILIDQDKFDVYYFKKDDWRVWALPYMSAIFDDLIMLERMKLADMSALDGAISNIRHWTVGIIDPTNPNNNILPTKAGINKIKNILANNVGGGTMDLVTGPEVAFKESNTQVHKFLGKEKYVVTLDNIYDGMGIPPPLRSGSSGGSSSATNNYVSLKTLIERLQYGRNTLIAFWNKQLKIVQKAMGHKYPGTVVFDQLILSDESAEKALLVQLVDRDIISAEAVREFFGFIPEIEKSRIKREFKEREADKVPPRASQYHNPQTENELKKILMQNGDVTPSEVGVELLPRKAGEKPRFEAQQETDVKIAKFKPKGSPLTGRPKNVTETTKRKAKPNSRPRKSTAQYVEDLMWAEKVYGKINDILLPAFLGSLNKSNARQLTNFEVNTLEDTKFNILSNITLGTNINKELVIAMLDINQSINNEVKTIFEQLKASYIEKNGHEPSLEDIRKMQVLAYLEVN